VVMDDRAYIQINDRERERLREFINRLGDDALAAPANEYWTVAGVLGHMAYWDNRVLVLAEKIDRGEPWVPSDAEPEGDWLTDSTRRIIHASHLGRQPNSPCGSRRRPTHASPSCPWTRCIRSTRRVPSGRAAATTEVSTSTSWSKLSATAAETTRSRSQLPGHRKPSQVR
jgi:hypothetical protein